MFYIHRNPANKILHTRLVEWNGYLHALTLGAPEEGKCGKFCGEHSYDKWIQPADISVVKIPPRPKSAEGGTAVMKRVAPMPLAEREKALLDEIKRGNVPQFLRAFVTVHMEGNDAKGKPRKVTLHVAPDYLAVGSDSDFVRAPLTPATAHAVCDAFDCSLPTRKMVDEIYKRAEIRLEPKPLGEPREAVETFLRHNAMIEEQRASHKLGVLVAGIKKDVVITNALKEKPGHVAIYGWHKLDGEPIQPLTTVHIARYVDYSHGIRLVKRAILVDGQPRDLREVLRDPELAALLSDEGPIHQPQQ